MYKEVLLVYLVNELMSNSMIIFTRTVVNTQRYVGVDFRPCEDPLIVFRLGSILKTLGFAAVSLHGQLSQSDRLGALAKFKSGGRNILIATDVASRLVFSVTTRVKSY